MTSQHGKQTNTIHIFPNISRSKSNETMILGQLIEYNEKYSTLKIMQKMRKETSSRPLTVFKKSFIRGKSKWSAT